MRRSALFPALDLSVLLLRQDRVGGKLGRGRDLHLQPDAQICGWSLCNRLCDLERRPVAADEFRRLRHGKTENRTKVKVVFKPTDGAPLPFFTPVSSSS